MSKFILKRVVDIIILGAILYALYTGYYIFFDRPTNPEEIASLYLEMGYSYLLLLCTLLIRFYINKSARS